MLHGAALRLALSKISKTLKKFFQLILLCLLYPMKSYSSQSFFLLNLTKESKHAFNDFLDTELFISSLIMEIKDLTLPPTPTIFLM